jgi:hypothetical protein
MRFYRPVGVDSRIRKGLQAHRGGSYAGHAVIEPVTLITPLIEWLPEEP